VESIAYSATARWQLSASVLAMTRAGPDASCELRGGCHRAGDLPDRVKMYSLEVL